MAGSGIQWLNIFLIVFPFAISLAIVIVRVWRRIKDRQFAIGKLNRAAIRATLALPV